MMTSWCCLAATAAGGVEAGGTLLSPITDFFDLNDPLQQTLVLFGLAGQAVFFGRWIVQWIASERKGESHMPELFWWCSLLGAMMLFVYFLLRREPVGLIGQSVGWTVYARNLYLIRFKKRRAIDEPIPKASADESSDDSGET